MLQIGVALNSAGYARDLAKSRDRCSNDSEHSPFDCEGHRNFPGLRTKISLVSSLSSYLEV